MLRTLFHTKATLAGTFRVWNKGMSAIAPSRSKRSTRSSNSARVARRYSPVDDTLARSRPRVRESRGGYNKSHLTRRVGRISAAFLTNETTSCAARRYNEHVISICSTRAHVENPIRPEIMSDKARPRFYGNFPAFASYDRSCDPSDEWTG